MNKFDTVMVRHRVEVRKIKGSHGSPRLCSVCRSATQDGPNSKNGRSV
jgi:hypothetical protein